jgi:hypothetical protein
MSGHVQYKCNYFSEYLQSVVGCITKPNCLRQANFMKQTGLFYHTTLEAESPNSRVPALAKGKWECETVGQTGSQRALVLHSLPRALPQ